MSSSSGLRTALAGAPLWRPSALPGPAAGREASASQPAPARSRPSTSPAATSAARPRHGEALAGPTSRARTTSRASARDVRRPQAGARSAQRAIPTERYRIAREQMARMPTYSTREGRFGAPGGRGRSGAEARRRPVRPTSAPGAPSVPATSAGAPAPSPSTRQPEHDVRGRRGRRRLEDDERRQLLDPVGSGETGMENLAVTSLAMQPGHANTLLAGTGEGFSNLDAVRGAGIFQTTNGGAQLDADREPGHRPRQDLRVPLRQRHRLQHRRPEPRVRGGGLQRGLRRRRRRAASIARPTAAATWTRIQRVVVNGGCLDLALRNDSATTCSSPPAATSTSSSLRTSSRPAPARRLPRLGTGRT